MECSSDTGINSPPGDLVLAPKPLKACRRCARLKMKCDSRERVPCTRCFKAHIDCHINPVGRQARIDVESVSRQKVAGLESQVEEMRKEITALRDERRQEFGQQPPGMPRDNGVMENNEPQDQTQFNELTAEEMAAPIAAVDAMASCSNRTTSEFQVDLGHTSHSQDLITRGVIPEERARILYDMLLGGTQPFIPIFDHVMDNFDSLRSRSTYCFTVIIMLAVQRSAETRDDAQLLLQCQDEARRLAGETLFDDPAKLESVQGMFLHAAYSEKTWFARGHALQMAVDLGFPTVFKDLRRSVARIGAVSSLKMKDRVMISKARTWLAIYSMEQESASGSSRLPRSNGPNEEDRQDFLGYPLSVPQDARLVANIELNLLRRKEVEKPLSFLQLTESERFRQRIENLNTSECLATVQATDAFEELHSWREKWDKVYQGHGFHENSLQRASLILQLNYIKIFVLCSVLGRLQKESRSTMWPKEAEPEIRAATSRLLSVMTCQLSQFLDTPVYKWQLKWAPSYSVITIAFTAVFALKITRLHPDLADIDSLLKNCRLVAQVLQTTPYTSFHRLLSLLITGPFVQVRISSDQVSHGQQNRPALQAPSWMPADFSFEDLVFADEGEDNFFDFDQMWSMDQQQQFT